MMSDWQTLVRVLTWRNALMLLVVLVAWSCGIIFVAWLAAAAWSAS